jgi:Tfp pilus assembly protein PilO
MSRTYRILLVAIVAVLAVGGYWKLALEPKRAEAADLAKQLATAQAQVAQTQSLLTTYRGAAGQYKANYATVVRLGKAIPADDDTRSLVVQLDAAAKRSGTDFTNLDVKAASASGTATGATAATTVAPGAVDAGSYSEMPFALGFTGDFNTLENFLGRVQHFVALHKDRILVNGRLMRIESIELQPASSGWPQLTVQLNAISYIVPPGQTDASTGTAAGPAGTTSTSTTSTATGSGSSGSVSDKPGSTVQ